MSMLHEHQYGDVFHISAIGPQNLAMNQRSALGDFLERYARDRGGDFLNDDGTINSARLGAFLGMSQPHVYRLITGATRHPRYNTVKQVAQKTGTPTSVILGEDPEPEVNAYSLEIARKMERLPPGERAIIEQLTDKFLELIQEKTEESALYDTGRFRMTEVDEAKPRRPPPPVKVREK